jgi:hypothetical protein
VYTAPAPYGGTDVRACLRDGRPPVTLGPLYGCADYTCSGIRVAAVGGAMVAFERAGWHSQLGSTHRIVVFDLARRTRVRAVPTGPLSPAQRRPRGRPNEDNVGIGPVTSLAVHPTGAVAWIARDFWSRRPGAIHQVRRADAAGGVRLAFGPDVAAGSLRLEDGRVTWGQGGRTRTAPLGPAV